MHGGRVFKDKIAKGLNTPAFFAFFFLCVNFKLSLWSLRVLLEGSVAQERSLYRILVQELVRERLVLIVGPPGSAASDIMQYEPGRPEICTDWLVLLVYTFQVSNFRCHPDH
jgi:hypothetical protein